MSNARIPQDLQVWIEARRRFHLSHAHVQMARELGLNPKKLGGLAKYKQEPWKAPLPQFIENLYEKRFGRSRPERVLSIEERAKELARKKAERKQARAARRASEATPDQPRAEGAPSLPSTQPAKGREAMTPQQFVLKSIMSRISEDAYCAGWLIDLEYRLWAALHDEPGAFPLNGQEREALRWLSQACGGWIYLDDGLKDEVWISRKAWAKRYAAWRATHPKRESDSLDLGEAMKPGEESVG